VLDVFRPGEGLSEDRGTCGGFFGLGNHSEMGHYGTVGAVLEWGRWVVTHYDVVIMTDLRFPGGSSASTLEEIGIQHANGIKTGLYHKPSPVMRARSRPFHRGIVEAVLDKKCDLLNMSSGVTADIMVVRHPSILHSIAAPLPDCQVGQVVLVVNHPPMNSEGRVDYLLPFVVQSLAAQYGTVPRVFPIGPLIRTAVANLYGGAALEPADWVNVFKLDRFMGNARVPPRGRQLRIGRHSRPGPEKWPTSEADIRSAYLVDSDNEVSILGGAEIPENILGSRPRNWTVYEFGTLDVVHFLNSIDVFVYFHHPAWIESFGRVIAEAMATGLPAILPHHFEPLFKQGAIYQTPEGVRETVDRLSDPRYYSEQSHRAIEYVKAHFSPAVHLSRLNQLTSRLSDARVEEVA
jgi:hypothetical protein